MNMYAFDGIRLVVSQFAYSQGARVKTYPRRKAKSEAHWRRMDKKWCKRYGFRRVPCMYHMRKENIILVAPELYPKVLESLKLQGVPVR